MNFAELDELVSWMRANGVTQMTHEGTMLVLKDETPEHLVGFIHTDPEVVADRLESQDEDPDDGFVLPQQRIRARLHKRNAEGNSTGR